MRNALGLVLAVGGAAVLGGAALAASRDTHNMNVPLPDGSTARVEYVGNVAPKVTVIPAPPAPFGLFDRSAFDMQRQVDAMIHEIDAMARLPMPAASGMNAAAYGNAPAGSTSVTVVSTGNGAKTCTRTTEVTAQGAGKPLKVETKVSGDCGSAPEAGVQKPTV